MGRAIWPALKQKSESRNLLILFLISTIAIAAFYGAGLMLFVLRDMNMEVVWKERRIKFAFWAINVGLAAMVLLSVLPVGLAGGWSLKKNSLA